MLSGSTPEERKVESRIRKSCWVAGPAKTSASPTKLSCRLMALQSCPELGRDSQPLCSTFISHWLQASPERTGDLKQDSFVEARQSPKRADNWGLTPPNTPGSWGNKSFISERALGVTWQCPPQKQYNSLFGFQTLRKVTWLHLLSHNTFLHSSPVSHHFSGLFWDHGRSKDHKTRLIHKAKGNIYD